MKDFQFSQFVCKHLKICLKHQISFKDRSLDVMGYHWLIVPSNWSFNG